MHMNRCEQAKLMVTLLTVLVAIFSTTSQGTGQFGKV
jgi:hypothetical protein